MPVPQTCPTRFVTGCGASIPWQNGWKLRKRHAFGTRVVRNVRFQGKAANSLRVCEVFALGAEDSGTWQRKLQEWNCGSQSRKGGSRLGLHGPRFRLGGSRLRLPRSRFGLGGCRLRLSGLRLWFGVSRFGLDRCRLRFSVTALRLADSWCRFGDSAVRLDGF